MSARPVNIVDDSDASMDCKVAFLIHKPIDVISSKVDPKVVKTQKDQKPSKRLKDPKVFSPRTTVYEIAAKANFPTTFGLVGRLDYETSGVMLMSSDNNLACAIRDPVDMEVDVEFQQDPSGSGEIIPYRHQSGWVPPASFDLKWKEKEYIVKCLSPRIFHEGVSVLLSEMMEPLSFTRVNRQFDCKPPTGLTVVSTYRDDAYSFNNAKPFLGWCVELRFVLREGKHHQIRRICSRSKLKVLSLTRVRLANILTLDSVGSPGACRWLTMTELYALYTGFGLDKSDKEQRLHQVQNQSEEASQPKSGTTAESGPDSAVADTARDDIANFIPGCILRLRGLEQAKSGADQHKPVNPELLKQAMLSLVNATGGEGGAGTSDPVAASALRFVDCRKDGCEDVYVRVSLPAFAVRMKTALDSCPTAQLFSLSQTAHAKSEGDDNHNSAGSCLLTEILQGEEEKEYWRVVRRDSDRKKRKSTHGDEFGTDSIAKDRKWKVQA